MAVRLLFICVGNAVRSQMAEGFARALGGGAVDARSGGSAPSGCVSPQAIAVMAEAGVDIAKQESKGIDWAFMAQADAVVATCHEAQEACPIAFRRDARQWNVPDPQGLGLDGYRAVRDEVEAKVRALLLELRVPIRELPGR